jgi:hypothetical protein
MDGKQRAEAIAAISDDKWRQMAKDEHQEDGRVEIDDNAAISLSEASEGIVGAYVQAWVWVDLPDELQED